MLVSNVDDKYTLLTSAINVIVELELLFAAFWTFDLPVLLLDES